MNAQVETLNEALKIAALDIAEAAGDQLLSDDDMDDDGSAAGGDDDDDDDGGGGGSDYGDYSGGSDYDY